MVHNKNDHNDGKNTYDVAFGFINCLMVLLINTCSCRGRRTNILLSVYLNFRLTLLANLMRKNRKKLSHLER